MCGFPVYRYGQRTISLWFDNSVQEGDGPILLVVLYCKPYGRVNTVNVLKEALFIGFLVDDKGGIYIPAPEPGGWGAVLRAFCSKYSMYKFAAQAANQEVKNKGHIVIPYTQGLCESIKKICGRYGIQTNFKGGRTIKNLVVSPRTKTQWSTKVVPSTGTNVGTLVVMMST